VPADAPTAAVLLIGDELLSGKIRDENGHFLARLLRRRGIRLLEMAVVGDRTADIGEALLRLCERADLVFTSGGVGPTHDDVTLAAIAACTGRPLTRNARMEEQLRRHYGERISDAALRMADLPRGTQLRAEQVWPVLRLDLEPSGTGRTGARGTRVYILPGVPGLLRAKLEHLEELEGELPRGAGWHLALLHTSLDESKLAPHLNAMLDAFADVEIGSYPRWERDGDGRIRYHVRVTFEAPTSLQARVEAAREELARRLGPEALCEPLPAP
jgi:molybdenum cofactor synthesis domain-containing protein